jgi:hypothetical protein
MCTVSISGQESSQIDTTTVTVVFIAVAGAVGTSKTLATDVADDYEYEYNLKT